VSTEKPLPPPPPSRGKHREVWVGLFVVAGLAATVVTLAVMTDAALFRGRYIVTTNVPNAGGIRKGDPVQMRGVNIGRIMGFTISQQQGVDMRLEIEGEYPIPKDSRVEVKASGLLGGMVAEVIPGAAAENAGWGDRLPGASGIGLFDKMDTLAGEADKVARKVQNLLSEETVKDLQGGAAEARKGLESLQAILKEQRGELRALTASLRRSAEGMEKVATGPELERTVKRVDQLVERLDGTLSTLDRSSKSVESILARMDRGEGTLGKLSTDDTLYENASEATANLNKATQELNKLLADFQAHPRKYINLKVF
jgi:phospholipid/cholesterol/gamma-HCH transport system substrate-binding protein